MKVIAINGSPRKNWNTDQLCKSALEGASSVGAETELIELGDYKFKGCVSCFACHLKRNMDNSLCFYKDELTEVLKKCQQADAIIVGSPVYYGFVTGEVRSFIERLLFPIDTYYSDNQGKRVVKIEKVIPTAMIYTMNARKDQMDSHHGLEILSNNENVMKGIFGYCESLYAFDTYQFKKYDFYTVNIFDPEHKKNQLKIQFPKDLQKAYELGERLVKKVRDYNV